MLCPFCLKEVKAWEKKMIEETGAVVYLCPNCPEQVPAMYVRDYRECPPVVISVIGFRRHGKTVYLNSLFYAFKKLIPRHWQSFYAMAANEECMEEINKGIENLDKGKLPDPSLKIFPKPAIVQVHGIPYRPNRTLLCYDTAGEVFEKQSQITQHAHFIKWAPTALFLIALPKLADAAREMDRLLAAYVGGMADLEAQTKNQHLVVVYTQADEILPILWKDIQEHLTKGSLDKLTLPRLQRYTNQLRTASNRLHEFTREELGADSFLNTATENFKSVSFSIVSALGAEPSVNPETQKKDRLSNRIEPRCVLDPILLSMANGMPKRKGPWSWLGR